MLRREFAASLAASAFAAIPKVPVGAHCWMFAAKQPGFDPYSVLEDVFRELKLGGVDGVELMHNALLHDVSVSRIRSLSTKHGLPVFGSSYSASMWDAAQRNAIASEARVLIPRIRQCGGTTLGISVGDARRQKTQSEFDAQADCLREIFRLCREEGVTPNLHNHVYEVANGEFDLRNTLERVPEAKLGPDIGWLFRAKVDPVSFIRRHGRRIVYAHLRNEKADGKWPETLAEGVIDYGVIGQTLRDTGFSGMLAIELAHERDLTPTQSFGQSIRVSREYVKTVMGF